MNIKQKQELEEGRRKKGGGFKEYSWLVSQRRIDVKKKKGDA